MSSIDGIANSGRGGGTDTATAPTTAVDVKRSALFRSAHMSFPSGHSSIAAAGHSLTGWMGYPPQPTPTP